MTPLIEFDRVSRYYSVQGRRRYVLKDISVVMPFGVSIGVLGRNGAGKSTMVRLMARADRPNRGRVHWAPGVEVSWPMGFGGGFLPALSGRDNIKVVSRIYGRDWREIFASVQGFAELGKYIEMPLNTYSSGMRSRFNFAMSVAMDFDCYLFDEIMSVADAKFRQRAEEEMRRLAGRSTFVVVSHRMQTIRQFCQCVYVLHEGRLEFFGDVNEGIRRYETL
ncbi:MAG: ABC transporter ATP-binding protein [Rhodospirillales bacterium]